MLNEGAFGKLTGALSGENERADDLIRLIGEYLYQSRRLRVTDETDAGSIVIPPTLVDVSQTDGIDVLWGESSA